MSINVSSAKIRLKGRLKLFHLRWQQREFQVFYSRTIKQSSIGNILDHFLLYFSFHTVEFHFHNGANAKCGFIKQKRKMLWEKNCSNYWKQYFDVKSFRQNFYKVFSSSSSTHFMLFFSHALENASITVCSPLLLHFNNFRCFK